MVRKSVNRRYDDSGKASAAKTTKKQKATCFHCHRSGHMMRDCDVYLAKVKSGWFQPPPCRDEDDYWHDDRHPHYQRDKGGYYRSGSAHRGDYNRSGGNYGQQPRQSRSDYRFHRDKSRVSELPSHPRRNCERMYSNSFFADCRCIQELKIDCTEWSFLPQWG